jgi:HAD superfamily hydrolase (TIGR01509 family)
MAVKDASNQRKRAVIFDLDGTLLDSMPYIVGAFTHAVEPFCPRPTEAEVLCRLGGPVDACLRNLLGAAAKRSLGAARKRLLSYERGRLGELKPFPGVVGLLRKLRARDVRLGVWTARDRRSSEQLIAGNRLGGFFQAVVCGDDLPNHKPDPEGLFRAVRLLGVAPREAIFVGDADADVMGGHAAGVHTIFIHHGRSAPAHIHLRASEVFARPREAYQAILGRFGRAGGRGGPRAVTQT